MQEASAVASKVCAVCGARYPGDGLFCPNDGAPLQSAAGAERETDDPYLGLEISGHIEIRQLAGVGAMGRVYRAFQRGIDRDVAVKILHRELSANAQLVSRFTREAKVASRLQHPNVVQVLLAGQLQDRALYMVMEYLDGLSLQSALAAAGGALPLSRALHIGLQLCEAAGEAHAQGIVHRDLKPENVMLVRRGSDPDYAKVLDFGIARINWGEQSMATAAGLIFGTARYISPEGAQGNVVGPEGDVYSIATLLFQMLSGRTPFEGDQAVGLLVAQIHDAPPQLKSIPRSEYVPDPIAEVIMANLAKDPSKRESDARGLGQALVDAAKQAGLSLEELSRPILKRQPSAMQLPPVQRTKQLDLTPDLADRLSPPAPSPRQPDSGSGNGASRERPPMGSTVKWEPPSEFQARLAASHPNSGEDSARPSGVASRRASAPPTAYDSGRDVSESEVSAPVAAPSSPRAIGGLGGGGRAQAIDATLDDAMLATPAPVFPHVEAPRKVPRTIPAEASIHHPPTHYTPPVPEVVSATPPVVVRAPSDPHLYSPQSRPTRPSGAEHDEGAPIRKSRGIMFVVLCFVVGAALAAGIAWRMGRIGGDGDRDGYVTRATDAMFKNRFAEPVGDNVREITDEGLRRFPNDRRLLDVRARAANELVAQAIAHRSVNGTADALKLVKLAHELDPTDPSAKRLLDQYEADLVTPNPSAMPPLPTTPLPQPTVRGTAPSPVPGTKVVVDLSAPQPRPGQAVELTARVTPPKGTFDAPSFVVIGPGVTGGARVEAQAASPGVFKASFTFPQGGKFEVAFVAQLDGKPVRGARGVVAGEAGPAPPPVTVAPPPPTLPTVLPPPPPPSASVKWL